MEHAGLLALDVLEQILDHLLLVAAGFGVDPIGSILHLIALVDEQRGIATVIDNQLRAETAGELQRLPGAPPIFFQCFTLPGKNRNPAGSDGRGSVVLGGENVAGNPADVGTEIAQRLDEHGRLNGHVQRAHDTDTGQRLLLAIFFTGGHQPGHFMLGDFNFLTPEFGKADVSYFVICEAHVCLYLVVNFRMLR